MSVSHSYRRYIAGVLLALYVVSATPVAYWHSHQHHKLQQQSAGTGMVHTPGEEGAGSVSENCSLCDQHYPVYYNNYQQYNCFQKAGFALSQTAYLLTLITLPVQTSANKGPPVFTA